MERNHPVGPPAVTEYDRLFETGFCELVECIVASTQSWSKTDVESDALVDCLAKMQESEEIFQFAAGGFIDFTRIASSNPQMWHDICFSNRKSVYIKW